MRRYWTWEIIALYLLAMAAVVGVVLVQSERAAPETVCGEQSRG